MEKFASDFQYYKNNEKIIPSVMGQKRRQVCEFLFAYWGVSDCFYDGLMPQTFLGIIKFSVTKKCAMKLLWHLGHRENNYLADSSYKCNFFLIC